jgi:3-hydroxyacyl-CoA dehydrogenase
MNIGDVKKVAVIGSGDMGHGIAQICAQAGWKVYMKDVKQEFLDKAMVNVKKGLDFLVSKGKLAQADEDNILNNLLKTTLDTKEAVHDAQVIIEAVPEIMDLKKSVFKEISDSCPADSILASNTSTMSISEIGTVVKHQDKFVGMHFFNPVNRMKLVEVIYGNKTSDATADLLCEISKKMSKVPIKVLKDRPGFIVNRIGAPNQALISAILDEGKIQPQEIDAVMKKMGMPMGPFEVADFVGLDVFSHTLKYYSETLSPQFKPGKYLADKVAKKELGKKSGKGIYDWSSGKAAVDTSKEATEISPLHFLSIQINEAVRVFKEGIAKSTQDIDDAMKFGMNAFAGPFAMGAGIDPKQLTDCLNFLKERYKLDVIFKPEPEIVDGSFKNFK